MFNLHILYFFFNCKRFYTKYDVTFFFFILDANVLGTCYFPQVFQGEYVTQSPNKETVTYSSITITPNAIPIWGNCHKRTGNNYILKLRYY